MIIIDFFVATYFAIGGNKYAEKSLEASLLALNISFTFNALTLFMHIIPPFLGRFFKIQTSPGLALAGSLICFILWYLIDKSLEGYYLDKYEYIKTLYNKFPRILLFLFVMVHFLGSVVLGILSLGNMLYISANPAPPMPF